MVPFKKWPSLSLSQSTKQSELKAKMGTLRIDSGGPLSWVTVRGPGGLEVQCSRDSLRRSSPILNAILGSAVSIFHIGKGHPLAVRQMLDFINGEKITLEVASLPPLASLAERYQVVHLMDACKSCPRQPGRRVVLENCTNTQTTSSGSSHCAEASFLASPTTTDDPTDFEAQMAFNPLDFSTVQNIVGSSLPKMFLLESFTESYDNLAKLLIAWIEYDVENRSIHIEDLLGQLEFEYLGRNGLASIMNSLQIINTAPQLLSRATQAYSLAGQWLTTFRNMGQSVFVVPESGNYFIVCRGGSGDGCQCGDSEGRGGKGVMLGGTFHLQKGLRLEIRISERPGVNSRGISRGGDGCCIGYRCHKVRPAAKGSNRSNSQFHLLMVAGGGGGASSGGWGVVDGEDAYFSVESHGKKPLLKNQCGCWLRGMLAPLDQVDSLILKTACGTMGRPYHSLPGLAGQSYLSSDCKGVYSQTGNTGGPSVSIYARPSYL